MDNLIDRLLEETRKLGENPDQFGYEEFVALVELRQQLSDMISEQGKPMPLQQVRINELLPYEAIILSRMQHLKMEAQTEIERLQNTKRQHVAYHQLGATSSFMFDQKQ